MTTYHSVKREIIINKLPEKVWKALTIPEERNKWETVNCTINLKIGGTIELDYGWGVSYSGTFVEIEEMKKLVTQEQDGGLTIWTITPQEKGTLVTIEYTGLWSGDHGLMQMENTAFGTYQFMRNFKSVLEDNIDIRNSFWTSWIGVLHRTISFSESTAIKIVDIFPQTPAFELLEKEDVITSINGEMVCCYDDFEKVITEIGPDKEVRIQLIRNEKELEIILTTIAYGSKISPSPAS